MQTTKLHFVLPALAATFVAASAMNNDDYETWTRREVLFDDLGRGGSITEALNSTWQSSANCPTGNMGCGKGK